MTDFQLKPPATETVRGVKISAENAKKLNAISQLSGLAPAEIARQVIEHYVEHADMNDLTHEEVTA